MDGANEIDTLKVPDEPKSSAALLTAIKRAERHFNDWQGICDRIDDIYSRTETTDINWLDPDYDLFWSSVEILKPSIYARSPKPVVAPMFNDRRKLYVTTADMLERSTVSAYAHGGIDEALIGVRDDLIFYNRGQLWITYDSEGGQKICIEHLDRKDFIHPPARKWCELPWVDRVAWLSRGEFEKRFPGKKDLWTGATKTVADGDDKELTEGRARVHEVWHKHDKMVYWVADGVEEILDSGKPHYDLEGFFPCPRPAYGTLRPRTLTPVPDYIRYAGHFRKINSLTRRIYKLLDMVRMKGLIPSGGDVGQAVEQLIADDSDAAMLVPVPGALLSSGAANFVQWLPIAEIAGAIQGLIEARRELFADYDRLSGISDIMRGETQANETLGAQRLKGQYGSVRVKQKCDEIVRISRDVTAIASEIMAEHFTQKTLLDMSQMEIPTKAELAKRIKGIEDAARDELKALGDKARQAMQQPGAEPPDPQQAQQQLQQAQQAIMAKYGPMLQKASAEVPIEDVMKLLRDHKARNFAFEIETDSTILTDEAQAKASSTEFYTAFTGGMQGLMGAASMGEEAVRVASEVLKYTLSPYRPPRSVMAAIDDFLDAAPQIAQRAAEQNAGGEGEEMAQANMALAQAEMKKAEAAVAKVQADTQGKMQEIQLKAAEAQAKAQESQQTFALEVAKSKGTVEETAARIEKIYAEIQKMGVDAQTTQHREQREDVKLAIDTQARAQDQAMQAQDRQVDAAFRAKGEERADRGQQFTERSSDRQMTLAEKQAMEKPNG